MSSIERTAYPRFPRLISARELHVFYTPASEEITWAGEVTNSDESLLGLVLALKCFQRMGRFPRDEEIPELVVDHVRRGLGLDAGVSAVYGSDRTRRHHRGLVRKRVGVVHNPARAREVAAGTIDDPGGGGEDEQPAGPDQRGAGDAGLPVAGVAGFHLTSHILRFGAYATDELHIPPDVFDPALDEVDFGGEQPAAA